MEGRPGKKFRDKSPEEKGKKRWKQKPSFLKLDSGQETEQEMDQRTKEEHSPAPEVREGGSERNKERGSKEKQRGLEKPETRTPVSIRL